MRALLRHRDARLYIAGQTLSVFGDTTLWLGVGIWVKLLTGSSSYAGLVFFFYALPYVAAPAAGLLVDRVRRRELLVLVNLASAVVVLLLLAVSSRHQLWLIYLVIALYGASGTLISSGQSAFLTVLVPADLLADANGILQTGREALRLISPLVGAGVVAASGTAKPLAIFDAVTFVLAAISLLMLRVREPRPAARRFSWRTEALAGFRHVWRTTLLRQIVLATAGALLVLGFTETIIFSVVQHGLHRSPSFVGVLAATQGVGAVIGGLTSARAVGRFGEGRTLAAGLALFAVGGLLLIPAHLPVVVAGIIVAGFGVPWAVVAFTVAIQRHTPPELQGRAAAAAEPLVTGPQTLSLALGAALVVVVDYRILLAIMGGVMLMSASWLATRPHLPTTGPDLSATDVALALAAEVPPAGEGSAALPLSE